MNKNYLIQITNNLYRLTLLFPKKEPLRYKIREIADEILAKLLIKEFTEIEPLSILEKLEILDGFLEVAKVQNWVKFLDILKIQEEYNRIKIEMNKIFLRSTERKITKDCFLPAKLENNSSFKIKFTPILRERQEKILTILKEKGRVQIWEVKKNFPEVTKRTLRRDFENLLKQGVIERLGERANTFYQIKK